MKVVFKPFNDRTVPVKLAEWIDPPLVPVIGDLVEIGFDYYVNGGTVRARHVLNEGHLVFCYVEKVV